MSKKKEDTKSGGLTTKKKRPSRAPRYVNEVTPENKKVKADFPRLLIKHFGIVSRACIEGGISREAYYMWRRSDEKWANLCEEAIAMSQDAAGDYVESKLYDLIGTLNPTAIIFYCKTKLRDRGYIERKDFEPEDLSLIAERLMPLIKQHEQEY